MIQNEATEDRLLPMITDKAVIIITMAIPTITTVTAIEGKIPTMAIRIGSKVTKLLMKSREHGSIQNIFKSEMVVFAQTSTKNS